MDKKSYITSPSGGIFMQFIIQFSVFFINTIVKLDRMFIPGNHAQPSLIFKGNARHSLIE
jgi:hypothetical protein